MVKLTVFHSMPDVVVYTRCPDSGWSTPVCVDFGWCLLLGGIWGLTAKISAGNSLTLQVTALLNSV